MRAFSTFLKVLMWTILVLSTGFQLLASIAIWQSNSALMANDKTDQLYNLWPLWVVSGLFLAAVILFHVWKKRPYIGLILAILAAVAMVVIALDLMYTFPERIGADGGDAGIGVWKMLYRHMLPVLIPLLMLGAWLLDRAANQQEERLLIAKGTNHFDLSGAPLFQDGESTLGLPRTEETGGLRVKEKRSVRTARRKMEESNSSRGSSQTERKAEK